MTFREILQRLVEDTPGALAAVLMGSDGIPIDDYRASGARIDLPALAVEFQRVLEEIALEPTGSLGKARYLMRSLLRDLQREL